MDNLTDLQKTVLDILLPPLKKNCPRKTIKGAVKFWLYTIICALPSKEKWI